MVASSRRSSHISTFRFGSFLTGAKYLHHEGNEHAAPSRATLRVWGRIASNLGAVAAILLSVATTLVLLNEGMFHRRVVQFNYQNDEGYWRPLEQACLLTAAGFVPNSCTATEVALLTTPAAWTALGEQLAATLHVPLSTTYTVTTCLVGCADGFQSAELHLVVGDGGVFPACKPVLGSQPIQGMAMVEAATADDYLLTVFADSTATKSVEYSNSDGTTNLVVADAARVLLRTDGSVNTSTDGVNSVIHSYPLGPRYLVTSSCISQVVDISHALTGQAGWSTGKRSGVSAVVGWACGHSVANTTELVLFQAIFATLALVGVAPDIGVTLKGLRGLLRRKPVLTYDLLSGLERRRVLLVLVTLSAGPGLLFVDVARIYFGTQNGAKIWFLSITTLGIFATFAAFCIATVVQSLPSLPVWRHKLLPLSTEVFVYGSILAVSWSIFGAYEDLSNTFYDVPGVLLMNVSGTLCACGAYEISGTEPASATLSPRIAAALVLCGAASIAYATVQHRSATRAWCMDVAWAHSNGFMTACGLPHWLSGLPLDQSDAVRIGNRFFCKPSMQARMGFATVVPRPALRKVQAEAPAAEDTYLLVSMYDLVPALLSCRWYRPRLLGRVVKNMFVRTATERLSNAVAYAQSDGTCVG
ncbi:hypothetical protein ACHHYP_04906 [Achlya hypogyna]|uniref:Transmembrane protein n=1 Tax=Achlya hypogyna TaxID=1202772 RepID=A0A1V9Z088_ACHHY|nr:hypothetical protein ACHHYP_04906 [Achlya hypogyna]